MAEDLTKNIVDITDNVIFGEYMPLFSSLIPKESPMSKPNDVIYYQRLVCSQERKFIELLNDNIDNYNIKDIIYEINKYNLKDHNIMDSYLTNSTWDDDYVKLIELILRG